MTAREEMDLLIRVTSEVAQKMLESGGLMHFGTVLGSKRDVQVLMPKSMKKEVAWHELEAYWKREIASKTDWRAIACCTFVTELQQEDHKAKPTFFIHLEHFDVSMGAEDVAYQYHASRGQKITLRETTRLTAERWLTSAEVDPS